ncbi:MAG: branched chain amino acid aminotransferase, partial [Sciscionella sp.]
CGTAAVITPVGHVRHVEGEFDVAGGAAGEVTMRLRTALTALQQGKATDSHDWMHPLT